MMMLQRGKPFRKRRKIKTILLMQPVDRDRYNINETEKRKSSRIISGKQKHEKKNWNFFLRGRIAKINKHV